MERGAQDNQMACKLEHMALQEEIEGKGRKEWRRW